MTAAAANRSSAFPLPEKAVAMHTIALAKTRSGKSSVLRLIVEHGLDRGIPVCILDPKGDWWGIKSSADGKRAGYPVVIFGGEHGDVPINAHAGKPVAELVATGNRPALIDLGGWMPGERTQFFIDFASTFFRLTRGARWLVIDECHNFAPQVTGGKSLDPQAAKMVHWANRLASEGGGKGVTLFSASQRPQKVHKDYVTSHDTLIALRVVHPLDRNAVKDWMDGFDPAKAKEISGELAQMERGEAWVWSPEAKFGPQRLQFPLFSTFDSFAAPTGEDHITKLKGWAEVDLDDVKATLAVVVEEAKANDPRALKQEVATLKRKLADAETRAQAPAPSAIAADAIRAKAFAEGAASRDDEVAGAYRKGFDAAAEQMSRAVATLSAPPAPPPRPVRPPAEVKPMAPPRPPPLLPPPPSPRGEEGAITGPEQRIIDALAFWERIGFERASNEQAARAAGYSANSTGYTNPRGALRSAGLVVYPSPNYVALTDAGRALVSTAEDHRSVRERLTPILSGPEARILDACPRDGSPISNDDLARAAGYSASSTGYTNPRGALRTLGLVTYPQPGFVAVVELWIFS